MLRPDDVELARSDERPKLDADGERFGLHERGAAVGRIVGNGEVVGGDGAGEDGEFEVAQFDFASQHLGEAGFQHGAKAVGVDQEGQREGADQQEGDERACDESDAFHWRLRVYYLRDSLHMRRTGKILAGTLALLLAGCLAAVWLTRDTAPNRAVEQVSVVDRRVLVTARQLLALAETTQEVELARQAARLADHEVDQAFATAVREAADFKPPKSGPVQQLNEKVTQAKARIAARRERIAKLEKEAPGSDQAAAQLEVAKAQLALDENELEDAQLDLARQGGDERGKLEQAAQEHTAAQNEPAPAARPAPMNTVTLGGQAVAWWTLGDRRAQVQAARQKAVDRVASLEWEHKMLEEMVDQKPAAFQLQRPHRTARRRRTMRRWWRACAV